MGGSSSSAISIQEADVFISQQFAGTCDITCQNIMKNIDVTTINSDVGSINFTQTCSTNGNCLFNNVSDAIADVTFKATNSTNAKNAWASWATPPFNWDSASSYSRQTIKEDIIQSAVENCKLSSYNEMDNISVFTANSTISDGISFDQTGSTSGSCSLNNSMSAAAYASGIANNVATSGKDKKSSKFENKKSSVTRIIIYLIVAVILIALIITVGYTITSVWGKKTSVIPHSSSIISSLG